MTNPSIRPRTSRIRPEEGRIRPEKTGRDEVGLLPTTSPHRTGSPSGNQVDGLPLDVHSKPRVLPHAGGGADPRCTIGGRKMKIEKQNIMIFKIRIVAHED